MPLCVRLITHPPRPYLPDPFIQLQSVMYLWYSVCCTGCCSCLAHMLLFLVQKFDKWQQVCTDLKKIPNHSHPTHLSHLICCSLPVYPVVLRSFFFFFWPIQAVSFLGDFSCAVAGLIFLEYTASAQWSSELLVITFGGGLKSYLVR